MFGKLLNGVRVALKCKPACSFMFFMVMIHCFCGEVLLHCVQMQTHKHKGMGGNNKYFHYLSTGVMFLQASNGLAYIL